MPQLMVGDNYLSLYIIIYELGIFCDVILIISNKQEITKDFKNFKFEIFVYIFIMIFYQEILFS